MASGTGYDGELIGETLSLINVVRQAFGKDPLTELPDAKPGDAGDCLYYRALGDIGVASVTGGTMQFASERIASVVGTLWGTGHSGSTVGVPHQFAQVIAGFDGHRYPHYEV